MFGFLKKIFIGLLNTTATVANASSHTKCILCILK